MKHKIGFVYQFLFGGTVMVLTLGQVESFRGPGGGFIFLLPLLVHLPYTIFRALTEPKLTIGRWFLDSSAYYAGVYGGTQLFFAVWEEPSWEELQARREDRLQRERDEVDLNMRILADQVADREPDNPELAGTDNSRWLP